MTALNAYLIGGGAVVLVWLATVLKAILWGAARERSKQDKARAKAAEDQIEMYREATAEERRVAAMSDDAAKAEAKKWAR